MKTSDTTFNEYLKTPNETNIFVQPICTKEVKILLASIDPNKSPDVYGISPKIIKLASDSLAPTLTDIFNSSFQNGVFPQLMKSACITPIYI